MVEFFPSVWSDYFEDLSVEEAVDSLIEGGFSCAELSINHGNQMLQREGTPEQIGQNLFRYIKERGFNISQGHLSFKLGLCDPAAVERLKKEIDLFLGIGIENAVIHFNGGIDLPEEERFRRRCESLSALVDYVRGTSIKLCLENLGSVPETHTIERIRGIMDSINSDHLAICLDTGHLHLVNGRGQANQTQAEFIVGAGKDLRAMHITNNSGAGDDHLMPYSSRFGIEWKQVVLALKTIGYKGLFNLEILGENKTPMYIRKEKLKFIKKMTDYMISDEFINE